MTRPDSDAYRLYVFDADGTLRRTTVEGQHCPNREGEWELIPGVRERLSRIRWDDGRGNEGARLGVASNQAGVARGHVALFDAYAMLCGMVRAALFLPSVLGVTSLSGGDDLILLCPHDPAAACPCRKPAPGMLDLIRRRAGVQRDEVLFVGDMESDREAAERARVDFAWAHEFFGRAAP